MFRSCFFFCLSLHFLQATAQDSTFSRKDANPERKIPKTEGALLMQAGIPSKQMQEAIKNNMGNMGFGLSILVVSNPFTWGKTDRPSPIRIGADLGYTYYGRFISDVNINGYYGSYKTSYGIAHLNAILRFRPITTQGFNPFVDVIGGGNFYFSQTKENLNVIESALHVQQISLGGTASASFNKGIGVGCSFGSPKIDHARMVIRATFNRGNSIGYVVRNSVTYNVQNNTLTYLKSRAPVSYFMVQMGIGL
jgi:hypothetical protein